ncbi:MAG: hypothetical protein JWO53_834 [Chlamydiia bacterium]|nr:hypothetical protein [Chlamydiia bacterium]
MEKLQNFMLKILKTTGQGVGCMNNILEVKHLSKRFPIASKFFGKPTEWVHAVEDVSFSVKHGEVLGIVGESGSGKSTLVRALLRLIEPTSGTVFFQDTEITKLSKRGMKGMRKKMQIVFQNPSLSLNPRKTMYETLEEVLNVHEIVKTKEEAFHRIEELLNKVGLNTGVLSRYMHELSLGQQQRICIARALSVEPELLILDESVAALDVSVQAQILNLLMELLENSQMSYLFISHDLAVVEHLSDRVLVMCAGKIVEEGDVEQVFRKPQHPYTKELLNSTLVDHPRHRIEKIASKKESCEL